jgi:hypothetical protein
VGGDRYGTSWFRGAYLFLDFSRDGAAQADAYLNAVEAAGGWDSGDIIPIVDAELGEKPGGVNYIKTTKGQQVLDVAGAAVDRLKAKTGRRVMLYGRSALAENHIKSHPGLRRRMEPELHPAPGPRRVRGVRPRGQSSCGSTRATTRGVLAGYPTSIPGFTKLDLSVFIKGAQKPTLDDVRARLL